MGVLLPDGELGVRRALPLMVDGHGDRRPGGWGPVAGPWPGRAAEREDAPGPPDAVGSRTWVLAVDPAGWPIQPRDLVVDLAGGREWLVVSADLRPSKVDPAVSWVRVTAHLRTGGSTRP